MLPSFFYHAITALDPGFLIISKTDKCNPVIGPKPASAFALAFPREIVGKCYLLPCNCCSKPSIGFVAFHYNVKYSVYLHEGDGDGFHKLGVPQGGALVRRSVGLLAHPGHVRRRVATLARATEIIPRAYRRTTHAHPAHTSTLMRTDAASTSK